jgi:hypothetical protein
MAGTNRIYRLQCRRILFLSLCFDKEAFAYGGGGGGGGKKKRLTNRTCSQ